MSKLLKNKRIFYSILICIFAVLLLSTAFSFNFKSASSDAASTSNSLQTNQSFTISVIDRETGEESTSFTQNNLAFGKAFVYKWSEVNAFKFNYNPDAGTPPTKKLSNENDPNSEYYDLSISIEFLQAYKEVNEFYQGYGKGYKNIESAYSTRATGVNSYKNLKNLPENFVLNVDEGRTASLDGETIKIQNWGIYRFKLLINGQQTYSDFFVLEPTLEISEIPTVSYSTTSSQSSLHNDYIFSVINTKEYGYIDTSKLTWFVTGKGSDGIFYTLTTSDLTLEEFQGKEYSPLYPDYNESGRLGLSFRFDDKGISGTWEVWCEYDYEGNIGEPIKSKKIKIVTGESISTAVIIWIIIGVVVISIVLAIIFGIRKVKKDRVY